METRNQTIIPVASLVLAMFLWGGSFVALKIAFQIYNPLVVIWGRMTVASLCFLFFIPRFRKVRYHKGDWKPILIMGLFEPCLYFIFEAQALVYTTASQAGMITAMLPLLVGLAAWIILAEHISLRTVVGFALAVTGACVLSLSGEASTSAPNPPLGNFYEFLAMVSATGYVITLKKLTARYSALFLTAIQAVIGFVFFSGCLFLPSTTLPTALDARALTAIFYLGAVVTMGAYYLYNYAVSQMPASRANAFVNLIPVFTIFLGWLILGESFNSIQFIASGVILAGVFLSQDR